MNQANGFSFEFWRVARCRSRHRVDSLRRLSHPKLWFVRRPGSSPGGCSDGTFRVPSILAHLLLLPVSSVSLAYPYYAINIPERYKGQGVKPTEPVEKVGVRPVESPKAKGPEPSRLKAP